MWHGDMSLGSNGDFVWCHVRIYRWILYGGQGSKIYATSTAIGAVTNIILNLVFTPILGALGAAIATTVCYVEVYAVRLVQSRKYIKMRINFIRDIISYILLAVQSIVLLFVDVTIPLYGILVGLFVVICIMYIKDIRLVVKKVLHR